jgi:hypothetical protein
MSKILTTRVKYVDLPVVLSRPREYKWGDDDSSLLRKEFEHFLKAPPFVRGMHPVSLRVGSGEDLPDIDDVDGEWLQECNEFMMHLDHRDAILLDRFSTYDYEDFFMEGNELAQEDQGLKYLDLCMFGSDEDKISGLMALALACSSLRDKKPSSKKPSAEFVKFVRDQFSAKTEVSLAFCDLMWEISLNIPKPSGDGDGDLLHYLRFDLNELQHSIRLK